MSDSFVTPLTVACQAPLSMGFPRQEYRRGLPFPSPGDLPNSGTELVSPTMQEDSLILSRLGSSRKRLLVFKVTRFFFLKSALMKYKIYNFTIMFSIYFSEF